MSLSAEIKHLVSTTIAELYPEVDLNATPISINLTKAEFEGDYTVVLFPYVKTLRMKPDVLGNTIGEKLVAQHSLFSKFSVVAGFLNLTIADKYFIDLLQRNFNDKCYGTQALKNNKVMVEYSSPNTNKPLHFGHLRNIFLGAAVSEILKATGNGVVKANLINDRGIHICKSMIAWKKTANGATPESTGTKGDHLVGDYYVKFNELYKAELAQLIAGGMDEKTAEKEAPIMKEAQDMLRLWEAGDPETMQLWKAMNGWVYEGFNVTYDKMGISFDKWYYESETYLLGKKLVEDGLKKGVLFKKENGSIWIDLSADGLDEKLLLRGDGTSVYITQDLGTAKLKYEDFCLSKSIYVIADEQNYHMQVLQLILAKLGEPCAPTIHHLSYGMVELPTGRMKSREGTVVDADDMIAEMVQLALEQTKQQGKTDGFTEEELNQLAEMIGLGALKFYLLRVDPKKKMIFDPKESIDLHGFTATFIQYAHARICSILRKEQVELLPSAAQLNAAKAKTDIHKLEKDLLKHLELYPTVLNNASNELNPSEMCNYCFQLAQLFNGFYAELSISKAESEEAKHFRLMLIVMTALVLRNGMKLMGIALPEKM